MAEKNQGEKQRKNAALLLFLSDYKNTGSADYRFVNGEKFTGTQTNDAPVKCLLKMALAGMAGVEELKQGQQIKLESDKKLYILCITSYKVMKGEGEIAWINFQDTVKKLQEKYIEKDEGREQDPFEIIPIPYDYHGEGDDRKQFTEEEEDTNHMAQRIFGDISAKLTEEKNGIGDVYVDYTGGMRDIAFLMTTIIRYLEFSGINCQRVVYSQYDKEKPENNRIREITYIYEMFQMINGVNEFVTTGRATTLDEVFRSEREKAGEGEAKAEYEEVHKLLENMVAFSDAMSICDMSKIGKYLTNISESIKNLDSDSKDNGNPDLKVAMLKQLFSTMKEKMYLDDLGQKDYHIKLIRWCVDNNMLQQALTLIEDKMPEIYIDEKSSPSCNNKVLSYKIADTADGKREDYLKALGPRYERNEKRKIFYYTTMDWNTRWRLSNSNLAELKRLKNDEKIEINNIIREQENADSDSTENNGTAQNSGSDQKTLLETRAEECQVRDEESFIKAYCKFRRLVDISSKDKPEQHEADYSSILKWCKGFGKDQFSLTDREGNRIYVKLQIELNNKIKSSHGEINQDYLETTLLLHSALKQERNCCNHASNKGTRLSTDVVKRAIEIYVKRVEKILRFIDS